MHYAFFKKNSPRTTWPQRAHIQQWCIVCRDACPSWGAPPWGPETWVMEVVELKWVKEGGLIALVRGTIKVVLLSAGQIACRTGSFLCGLK